MCISGVREPWMSWPIRPSSTDERRAYLVISALQFLEAVWRAAGRGGLGREADRCVCRAVLAVAVTLDDLDSETLTEGLGIGLQELAAVGIAIIEDVECGQAVEEILGQTELAGEIVVIIARDGQEPHAARTQRRDRRPDVVGGAGDVLHAGAAIGRDRAGERRIAAFGNVERDPHGVADGMQRTAAD